MTRKNVRIGDVVRIVDWKGGEPDGRHIGTVLSHQSYKPSSKIKYNVTERISEVMWQDGNIGWILTDRIESLNKENFDENT